MTISLLNLGAIALEFGIGLIIGVFLKNEQEELSIIEIKFASLLFIVVGLFYYVTAPELAIHSILPLSFLWMSLITGVLIGEMARIKFLRRIVLILKKKDIQLAIAELQTFSTRVAMNNDPEYKAMMLHKLDDINTFIGQIQNNAEFTHTWSRQLDDIRALCYQYADLSIAIGGTDPYAAERQELMQELGMTGDDLAAVAFHTLNHAERDLQSIDLILPRRQNREASKRNRRNDQ